MFCFGGRGRTPAKLSFVTENIYVVWSDDVYAFIWPPWSRINRLYSDSSGYLAVPRKSYKVGWVKMSGQRGWYRC